MEEETIMSYETAIVDAVAVTKSNVHDLVVVEATSTNHSDDEESSSSNGKETLTVTTVDDSKNCTTTTTHIEDSAKKTNDSCCWHYYYEYFIMLAPIVLQYVVVSSVCTLFRTTIITYIVTCTMNLEQKYGTPPKALTGLALLTILIFIVHPDGYTWIVLRKLRYVITFLFFLFQIFRTSVSTI